MIPEELCELIKGDILAGRKQNEIRRDRKVSIETITRIRYEYNLPGANHQYKADFEHGPKKKADWDKWFKKNWNDATARLRRKT